MIDPTITPEDLVGRIVHVRDSNLDGYFYRLTELTPDGMAWENFFPIQGNPILGRPIPLTDLYSSCDLMP